MNMVVHVFFSISVLGFSGYNFSFLIFTMGLTVVSLFSSCALPLHTNVPYGNVNMCHLLITQWGKKSKKNHLFTTTLTNNIPEKEQ